MKKKSLIFLVSLLFIIIIIPISVKAINWQNQEEIYISSSETVDGNFFFLAENVKIDGNINGDLVGLAENLEINGRVEGDILIISQKLNFNGEVVGSFRGITNQGNINGIIGKNLNIAGVNIFISELSNIYWDALILADNLDLRAKIKGNLYASLNTALLNGQIERNVNLILRNKNEALVLGEKLEVNNSLNYQSLNEAIISPEAQIDGDLVYKELKSRNAYKFTWSLFYQIFSALLIALFLVHLFKNILRQSSINIEKKFIYTLIWGLFLTIALPIILLILAFTIIGFKLSLIIFSLWLALILSAKVIFAFFIGRFLFNKILKKTKTSYVWKIIIGIVISWLLFSLPYIGIFFSILAIILGMGSFFLVIKKYIKS
jgi:hypothetical protein